MQGRKAALRAQLRRRRSRLLPAQAAESDAAITRNLLEWPVFCGAETILTYVSTPGEVDTLAVIAEALARGKKVAVPRCLPGGRMVFCRISTPEKLVPGAYGIPEPAEDCPVVEGDAASLCLVPGLTFDSCGNRIGYGGGYYDRFLAGYAGTTVGLVRQSFLSQTLPAEKNDRRVAFLAAESGIVKTK